MANTVYHYIENYSNAGKIGISFEVIGDIVKYSLKTVENITINKNINCEVKDNLFIVNIPIKIKYGSNINELTEVIQEKAVNALQDMCEITNCKINVKVDGIVVK